MGAPDMTNGNIAAFRIIMKEKSYIMSHTLLLMRRSTIARRVLFSFHPRPLRRACDQSISPVTIVPQAASQSLLFPNLVVSAAVTHIGRTPP